MKLLLVLFSESIYGCNVRGLSSLLKSRGHSVKLFFVSEKMNRDLCARIIRETEKNAPDAVGMSVMTDVAPDVEALSVSMRKEISAPILWGGVHTGIDARRCLEFADYVFIGEADETLPAFAESFRPGEPFIADGVISRRDPAGRAPAFAAPAQDIESLPFQDLDWEDHLVFADGKVFSDRAKEEALLGNTFHAMMSRGCPYDCAFCYNNYIKDAVKGKGRYFREMSVGRVLSELEYAKKKFSGLRKVRIWDDNFLSRKYDEVEYFSKEYRKRIGLPFHLLASPLNVSREKLLAVRDAGLESIQVGLQSGSEKINRTVYRRPISR